MFLYQLKLSLKSIVQTPWISMICILAIALGVSVATSMTTIHHVFSRNPLPQKSDRLFNVRLDTWDPNSQFFDVEPGEPPKATTYQDMANLMRAGAAIRETGVANSRVYVFPEGDIKPYSTVVRLAHADFFTMFDVPFRYGSSWTRDADHNREPVTVLSEKANDKLFGGVDSVGETIRLGAREFRVIGVLDTYNPTPMFYDIVNSGGGDPREFFVPFDHVRDFRDLGWSFWGDTDAWGDRASFQGDNLFTAAEFHWIQHWVELDPDKLGDYTSFVDNYSMDQKALGRHPRPINNRVTPMMDWVNERSDSIDITKGVMFVSFLFLAVCAINITGLLLGKFLSRASLIGVHRALGASRRSVFIQHILESETIGVIGGALGLLFSVFALQLVNGMMPPRPNRSGADMFQLDSYSLVISIGLSLLAGLLAGLYPAWRACRVAPAVQLKV